MEQEFTIAQVIELMKKTKKTDPLFKPLKKIKTALQSIGLSNVSLVPTRRILAFHFGLGNQVDKEFLKLSKPLNLANQIEIIPGSSYCILQFATIQDSTQFVSKKQRMQNRPFYFQQLTYQNLSRTLIYLFCKQDFMKNNQIFEIPNCESKYKQNTIPGLIMIQDIVSKQEELQLLENIDKGKWDKLNNRRVQHHGYAFKYGRNQIDKDQQEGAIPPQFNKLIERLSQLQILKNSKFDQLTINDYFAGNGIPSHFDTHSPFQEIFVSISLLSGLVMDFRKYNGQEKSVFLKERSLVIFSGQARYAWFHGISGRKVDKISNKITYRSRRISLTFRQIKFTHCTCPFYFFCDSQGYNQETMKKNNPLLTKYMAQQANSILQKYNAKQIEKQFVQKAYNGFGFDFHNKVIEQIKYYIQEEISLGDIVLDIGCGNGQYMKYFKQGVNYIGIQKCTTMIPVPDQFHMDCLNLAFKSQSINSALYVAVLHHLASEETRLQSLRQIHRVLVNKGILYLSVLNYQIKKQIYSKPDILLQYCLPVNKLEQKQKTKIIAQQQIPRIQQRGEVYSRFYHLFTQEELVYLLQKSCFTIKQIQKSKQNIVLKAIKYN